MASISKPRTNADGSVSVTAEIRIKNGGQIVHKESKTIKKPSEREARRLAERWAGSREDQLSVPGALASLLHPVVRNDITVAELIDQYIEVAYPFKPWGKSKSDTLRLIRNSDFGTNIARLVNASDIIGHCRAWSMRSSPQTSLQHYIFIRGVFSVAEDLLGCPVQYSEVDKAHRTMVKLGIIGKSAGRERRPTVEEMTDMVSLAHDRRKAQAMKGHRSKDRSDLIPMDKIMVFAIFSGRRQAEITRMRRSETDFERRRVLIREMKHPTKKASNDVWVIIPERAWNVMLSMPVIPGKEDYWFPYFSRSLGDRFRVYLKESGHYTPDDDENFRFHDMRHECASWLFEQNGYKGQVWDVPRVAAVTGHQDWGSLQRYTQISGVDPYDKWEDWEWTTKVLENF
ncbi:MAG: hypothetical protein CMI13_07785 [Oleibacter sp.]|nr:hypothetical protein [Thalassolituus sp.]